jgi:hypothetical protein
VNWKGHRRQEASDSRQFDWYGMRMCGECIAASMFRWIT